MTSPNNLSVRATQIRKVDYEPWLLGFCRWEIALEHKLAGGMAREVFCSGSWKWRGRHAHYVEYTFEVGAVGEITANDSDEARRLKAYREWLGREPTGS